MEFLINTFWILLFVYTTAGWMSLIILANIKFRFKKIIMILIVTSWILSASYTGQSIHRSFLAEETSNKQNKFESQGVWYNTKEEYCRSECRYMLKDLADTWGNNTNNQDSISKTIMDCYYDCIK